MEELVALFNINFELVAALAGVFSVGVFLYLQGFKVLGLVKNGDAGIWALGIAGVIGVLAGVAHFVPAASGIIVLIYSLSLSVVISALFYKYLAVPILKAVFPDLPISTEELNG